MRAKQGQHRRESMGQYNKAVIFCERIWCIYLVYLSGHLSDDVTDVSGQSTWLMYFTVSFAGGAQRGLVSRGPSRTHWGLKDIHN